MTDDLARALQRPGVVPAFVTALGILVGLVALGFLQATFGALSTVTAAGVGGEFFAQIWAAQLAVALTGPVPIAIGVFVCFWQVAPIAPSLRLAHVVTRALLAALAGAVLLFVLGLALAFGLWLLGLAGAFDQGGLSSVTPFMESPLVLLFRTLGVLVGVLPLVVLGAVLLWGWLQRHPPKVVAKGSLDEV